MSHGMSGKQSFCRLSSVYLSKSVMSNSLWPRGPQHARLPCPSPTPGAFFNSYPLSCHPTISSSVNSFSSCLQPFPAIASFSMSQFLSGGQSIGDSASASVLPMNIQDWFPLGLTGFISFSIQGTLRCLLQHHSSKASILWCPAFFMVQLSHPYMTVWIPSILFQSYGKTIALIRQTFVRNVSVFDMLCRLVIAFLRRSKCLLISSLQWPSAVILEPKKIKYVTVSIVSPSICHEVIGTDAMIFVFSMLSFKAVFVDYIRAKNIITLQKELQDY